MVSVTSSVLGARFGETLPQFQFQPAGFRFDTDPKKQFWKHRFFKLLMGMADVKNYM